MSPFDKESIMGKIEHCLALSKSANSNEAAIALKQAQALMKKYQIFEIDIALSQITSATTPAEAAFAQPSGKTLW